MSLSCATCDELAGGLLPSLIWNVTCASTASLERGDLICAASLGADFSLVSSAGDASKMMAICAAANDGSTATTAYVSGEFNREKINAGSLSISIFEPELRRQGIFLTSIKE